MRLTTELIIVVLIDEIHAYKFCDLSFISKWIYASNPFAFFDFRKCADGQHSVLAFLDTESPWEKPPEHNAASEPEQCLRQEVLQPDRLLRRIGLGCAAKRGGDAELQVPVRFIAGTEQAFAVCC